MSLTKEIVKHIYDICGITKNSHFPLLAFKLEEKLQFLDEDDNKVIYTMYSGNVFADKKKMSFLLCSLKAPKQTGIDKEQDCFLFVQYENTPAYALRYNLENMNIYVNMTAVRKNDANASESEHQRWVAAPILSQATILYGLEQLLSLPVELNKDNNQGFINQAKSLILEVF